MKSITTERLCWLLVAGALISWSLHVYTQFERPGVGWFEAAFGGWSMLPLGVAFAVSRLIARIRAKTLADDAGFYEKGVMRYGLVALAAAASVGLVFLGVRPLIFD